MLLEHSLDQSVPKMALARRFGINRTMIPHWIKTGPLDRDLLAGPRGDSLHPPVAHKWIPARQPSTRVLRSFPGCRRGGYSTRFARRAIRAAPMINRIDG